MVVYIKVTNDEYELPVAVADTAAELARIVGSNENTIRSAICHYEKGRRNKSIYHKVEWEDEME